jgi:hypothetical protein
MLSSPPRESSTRPKPREDWIWRYIGEIASTPTEQRTRTIQVSSDMCQAFSEIERDRALRGVAHVGRERQGRVQATEDQGTRRERCSGRPIQSVDQQRVEGDYEEPQREI